MIEKIILEHNKLDKNEREYELQEALDSITSNLTPYQIKKLDEIIDHQYRTGYNEARSHWSDE